MGHLWSCVSTDGKRKSQLSPPYEHFYAHTSITMLTLAVLCSHKHFYVNNQLEQENINIRTYHICGYALRLMEKEKAN